MLAAVWIILNDEGWTQPSLLAGKGLRWDEKLDVLENTIDV
jgi:hypothetical protein